MQQGLQDPDEFLEGLKKDKAWLILLLKRNSLAFSKFCCPTCCSVGLNPVGKHFAGARSLPGRVAPFWPPGASVEEGLASMELKQLQDALYNPMTCIEKLQHSSDKAPEASPSKPWHEPSYCSEHGFQNLAQVFSYRDLLRWWTSGEQGMEAAWLQVSTCQVHPH